MKPLVALYKTYRGGEWFLPSLESVRPHCVGVVVVSTSKPWKGLPGTEKRAVPNLQENCRKPLAEFQQKYPDFSVTMAPMDGRCNSEDQYRVGLAIVRAMHGSQCGVLIVDTDEVWEEKDLVKLREMMSNDHTSLYFRSGIYTYLRSPLYRVYPEERSRVVVGLANPEVRIGDSRFSGLARIVGRDKIKDVECSFHHLGYVRLDPEEIISKLSNTSSQDAVANRPNWKQLVWDYLPAGNDIHPAVGYANHWQGVRELSSFYNLPKEITNHDVFWACLGHHKGGFPMNVAMKNDPIWRAFSEGNPEGITTEVREEFALSLCAALGGNVSQEKCIYLTPRLRMSFRETIQLAEHAKRIPHDGCALEIGSGMGGSMAILGSCSPKGTLLFAVDPYVPYDEENNDVCQQVTVGTAAEFMDTIRTMGVRSCLYQMSSKEAAATHKDMDFDMVLIDGNHSYDHVKYDLATWWKRLKSGGVLLLHDLSGRFPGVVRAAREFEEEHGLSFNLPTASSLAWLQKP